MLSTTRPTLLRIFLILALFVINLGATKPKTRPGFGNLPLYFEPVTVDSGDTNAFVARVPGYSARLTPEGLTLAFQKAGRGPDFEMLSIVFEGALRPRLEGENTIEAPVSYFIGSDPTNWIRRSSRFGAVRAVELFPGIDARFYGTNQTLEWDFLVHPGADPTNIRFRLSSPFQQISEREIEVRGQGYALLLKLPSIFQAHPAGTRELSGSFQRQADGSIGIQVLGADPDQLMVIDPTVEVTYVAGGSMGVSALDVGTDDQGNLYLGGWTSSPEIPFDTGWPPGAIAGQPSGFGFVTKLNPQGTQELYSVYVSGGGLVPYDFAVDPQGRSCLVGSVQSDLPTRNAFQSAPGGGGDGFVTCINSMGTDLLFSTYLGGTEYDQSIALDMDSSGRPYVAGVTTSSDFPLMSPFQDTKMGTFLADVTVTVFSPAGGLVYSTYLGGTDWDTPEDIAVDSSNRFTVIGSAESDDFPLMNPIIDQPPSQFENCFVSQFSSGNLLFSTYFGGENGDLCLGVAVDNQYIYLTGQSNSSQFPVQNAIQDASAGGSVDAFVTKICPGCAGDRLIYSTFLGGVLDDMGWSITVDDQGRAVVGGETQGAFPAVNPLKVSAASSVFESVDGGDTWTSLGLVNPIQGLARIGNELFAAANYDGLFRRMGDGPWTAFNDGLDVGSSGVMTLVQGADTLYIGTSRQGLMRRRPGDPAWVPLTDDLGIEGLGPVSFVDVVAAQGNRVYLSGARTILRSDDRGNSWVDTEVPLGSGVLTEIWIDPDNNAQAFAYTRDMGFRTDNSGGSWQDIPNPVPPSASFAPEVTAFAKMASTLLMGRSTHASGVPVGVLYSTDNGSSWNGLGLEAYDVLDLAVVAADEIIAATSGGLFRGTVQTTLPDILWERIGSNVPGGSRADLLSDSSLVIGIVASRDGFVSQFSADGQQLLFSSQIGGGGEDRVMAVASFDEDSFLAGGRSESGDFPLSRPEDQQVADLLAGGAGFPVAFLTKISSADPMTDLVISKVDSTDPVLPGEAFSYTITVQNMGPVAAQDVVVTESLPAGVSFVSTSGCVEDPGGNPTCNLGMIPVAGSAQVTVNVTAAADAAGTLTNNVSLASSTPLINTGDDTASEDTEVAPVADLSITKTDSVDPVSSGAELSYTIRVENRGPASAEQVVVTDTLPAGVTLVSTTGCGEDPGGAPTCSLGTLGVGEQKEFEITVQLDPGASGSIENSATASSATQLINTGDDSATETTTVSAAANLVVTKSDSSDPVEPGEFVTYLIEVRNSGGSAAEDVVATETLPSGVTLESTSGCVQDPAGVPTCTLGNLAPGASTQFEVVVQIDPETRGVLENRVSVTSSSPLAGTGDDEAVEETRVVVLGDADGDGTATVADAQKMSRMLLSIDPVQTEANDLNENGQLDIGDLTQLVNRLLGRVPMNTVNAASGGVVTAEDGARLVVPPNSGSGPIEATLERIGSDAGTSEDVLTTVSAKYRITLLGESLGGDLSLSLPVDPRYFPEGFPEDQVAGLLRPEVQDPDSGDWQAVGTILHYDPATELLTFDVPIDSEVEAVLAAEKAEPATTDQHDRVYQIRLYLFSSMRTVQRPDSIFRFNYYPQRPIRSYGVPTDEDWNSTTGNAVDPEVADFVEDLDASLNAAYDYYVTEVFSSVGLSFTPRARIEVYIQDTGGEAGNADLGGPMKISNSLISSYPDMKRVAAHELAHVLQGKFYFGGGLLSGSRNRWFLEATATYLSARANQLSTAERNQYYSNRTSSYLSISIKQQDDGSQYTLAHFIDWLSRKFDDRLVGDAFLGNSLDDLLNLGRAIQDRGGLGIQSAFEDYLDEILTQPEDFDAFNGFVKDTMNAYDSSSHVAGRTTLGGGDGAALATLEKRIPPLATAYIRINAGNQTSGMLVIDPSASVDRDISWSGYDFLGRTNAEYMGAQAISTGVSFPESRRQSVTVPYFGRNGSSRTLEYLLVNSATQGHFLAHVNFYLLLPPVITDRSGQQVTWRTQELGGIPASSISGYTVCANLVCNQSVALFETVPATLSVSVPGLTDQMEVSVHVTDRFGNTWPLLVMAEPPEFKQALAQFDGKEILAEAVVDSETRLALLEYSFNGGAWTSILDSCRISVVNDGFESTCGFGIDPGGLPEGSYDLEIRTRDERDLEATRTLSVSTVVEGPFFIAFQVNGTECFTCPVYGDYAVIDFTVSSFRPLDEVSYQVDLGPALPVGCNSVEGSPGRPDLTNCSLVLEIRNSGISRADFKAVDDAPATVARSVFFDLDPEPDPEDPNALLNAFNMLPGVWAWQWTKVAGDDSWSDSYDENVRFTRASPGIEVTSWTGFSSWTGGYFLGAGRFGFSLSFPFSEFGGRIIRGTFMQPLFGGLDDYWEGSAEVFSKTCEECPVRRATFRIIASRLGN